MLCKKHHIYITFLITLWGFWCSSGYIYAADLSYTDITSRISTTRSSASSYILIPDQPKSTIPIVTLSPTLQSTLADMDDDTQNHYLTRGAVQHRGAMPYIGSGTLTLGGHTAKVSGLPAGYTRTMQRLVSMSPTQTVALVRKSKGIYTVYEYAVQTQKIVTDTDTSIMNSKKDISGLVVYGCYPFDVADTDQRIYTYSTLSRIYTVQKESKKKIDKVHGVASNKAPNPGPKSRRSVPLSGGFGGVVRSYPTCHLPATDTFSLSPYIYHGLSYQIFGSRS